MSLFVPENAPVVVGIDETIERRRGSKIAARGIYRDPVRSSKEFFVKTSGLRWISMLLLTPIPWAGRVWALPFLTVLAPSEHYHEQRKKTHKTITDWARQMIRQLIIVADGSYAVVAFLANLVRLSLVTLVTRMRWMRHSMIRPPHEKRGSAVGQRSKANASPPLPSGWPIPKPCGRNAPLPGMGHHPSGGDRNWHGSVVSSGHCSGGHPLASGP